jgi:CDP-6-deoxy-D-xylo-4-hexulose-3-dehydrase
MDEIMRLKSRHGFLLMEDCCASHGSTFDGQKVGTFGELSTFSFYYGHHMSTIEGGVVCTNDPEIQDVLLMTRSHGWAKDVSPEKEAALAKKYNAIEFNRTFTFYYPGYNFRATDLSAKFGLLQIKRLPQMIERRVENHRAYQARLLNAPGFTCQRNSRGVMSSISFAAMASSEEHRARVAQALSNQQIETRPLGGGNMSRQPFWYDRYGATTFPFADRVHECCLQLPNHHLLSLSDVEFVCDTVLSVAP